MGRVCTTKRIDSLAVNITLDVKFNFLYISSIAVDFEYKNDNKVYNILSIITNVDI